MTSTYVDGWRYDIVSPYGLYRPFQIVGGVTPDWLGWFHTQKAVCEIHDHRAPRPGCKCGVHLVDTLGDQVAASIEGYAALRDEHEHPEAVGVMLSRVRAWDVLPGAARSDPPGTWRAHRLRYLEWMIDNEAVVEMIQGDDRLGGGFPPVRYVPDLAAWVRERAADDLEAQLEAFLGPKS